MTALRGPLYYCNQDASLPRRDRFVGPGIAKRRGRAMNRVLISEQEEASRQRGFRGRHPVLSYVFGDTVKGLYVVACLALDLFLPAQLRLSFPGRDVVVLPSVSAAVIVLVFGEIRLYRRLWPPRGRRTIGMVEERES